MPTREEIIAAAEKIKDLPPETLQSFLTCWFHPTAPHLPIEIDASFLGGRTPGLKAVYLIGGQEITLRVHDFDGLTGDRWFTWQLTLRPKGKARIHAAIGTPFAEDVVRMFAGWVQRFTLSTSATLLPLAGTE